MGERWKAVPAYEGLYEVSDMGQVRSLDRPYKMRNSRKPDVIMDCVKRGRLLKQDSVGKPYAQVLLYDRQGKPKRFLVHRLVLLAFVGEAPGMECNHRNGDTLDNALINLEWVTHGENMVHSRSVLEKCRGEENGLAKLTEADVLELRAAKANGEKLTPLAIKMGVSITAACNAAKGKTWAWVT
jgi:hypothetical protein